MTRYDAKMKGLDFYYVYDTPALVDDDAVKQLERVTKHQLPSDYLEFVKSYGVTGFKDYATAQISKSSGKQNVIVSVFYGIGKGDDYDVLTDYEDLVDDNRIPTRMIPIAGTPGTSYFLLSLSGDDNGKVYFWDQTEEATVLGSEPSEDNLYFVANSFEDFLMNLQEESALAAA
jgi:hypothetical protein